MAVTAKLTVYPFPRSFLHYIRNLGFNVEETLEETIIEAGDIGVQIIQEEAPEKTGRLKASVVSYRTEKMMIKVGPTAPYSIYVEKGTSPHLIEGHPVLSWINESGVRVWATHVHHPGTTANPFIARSRIRMQEAFKDLLLKKLRETMK